MGYFASCFVIGFTPTVSKINHQNYLKLEDFDVRIDQC
jgi:hypothetical protein